MSILIYLIVLTIALFWITYRLRMLQEKQDLYTEVLDKILDSELKKRDRELKGV